MRKSLVFFGCAALACVAWSKPLSDAEKFHSTEMNAGAPVSSFTAGDVKVAFVGHSMMKHGPLAKIGWTNDWGMAASAPEKDYVHIVTRGIERMTGRKAAVKLMGGAAFERNFRTYDLTKFAPIAAFEPDYLVVTLGENSIELTDDADFIAFRDAYTRLLRTLVKSHRPKGAVVRGVFWPNPRKDSALRSAAEACGFDFVRADCHSEETIAGTNRFWHLGVAHHAGDVGMKIIADRILDCLDRKGAMERPRDIWPTSELRFRLDAPASGFVFVGCVRKGQSRVEASDWCKFTVTKGEREYRIRPCWKKGRVNKITFTDIRDSDGAGERASVRDFKVVDSGAQQTLDTKKFDGVVFNHAAPDAGYATLRWTLAEGGGAKDLSVPLVSDGRKHAYWYDLKQKGAGFWHGTCDSFDIVRLGREFSPDCRSVPVECIRFVKGVPDLPPDPVIVGAAPREAIVRAGRPLELEVVVRNLGTRPVEKVRFSLAGLPAGLKVTDGLEPAGTIPASTGESCVRAGLRTLVNERRYLIRLSAPVAGRFDLTLALTADGADARTTRIPVDVLPSLGLATCAYVPEPKPVKTGPYEIGAFLFPGWDRHSFACVWSHQLARKPLLGWYDETKPETIDWQIKQLVENGISFVSVDWYWCAGKMGGDDHWVKAFKASRYHRYLKWHLMWANHNPKGSHNEADQIRVTRHWIENYFNMPEYQVQDGKPIVTIWAPWAYERDLGKGGCKRMLDLSRAEARKAGYPGIHFILMRWPCGRTDASFLDAAEKMGFDESTTYKYCGIGSKDMRLDAAGGIPFNWVADSAYDHYRKLKANSSVPVMPNLSTGYDDRPWRGEQGWFCSGINAKDFRRICEAGKRFSDETGVRRLILGPLDEWGEGSIGYPNAEHGWGILEAVRETFGEKPARGWPVNAAPEDYGLTCPQFPEGEVACAPSTTADSEP